MAKTTSVHGVINMIFVGPGKVLDLKYLLNTANSNNHDPVLSANFIAPRGVLLTTEDIAIYQRSLETICNVTSCLSIGKFGE